MEWEEVPGTTTEVSLNLFPEEISEEAERCRHKKMARSGKKYLAPPQR